MVPHNNLNIQRGTISRPVSPNVNCVKLNYSTTTLILENVGPPSVSNADLGSAKLEWDCLRKASRLPSPLKRRSISCNRTHVGMKTRDTLSSSARSVSRTRTLCSENSIQPELKYSDVLLLALFCFAFMSSSRVDSLLTGYSAFMSFIWIGFGYLDNSLHSFKPQLEDIKSSFQILNDKK